MRVFVISTVVAAAALTACSEPASDRAAPAEAPVALEGSSANRSGSGAGVVTAVDAAAGSVTLQHGPIAELAWPAMTMSFPADRTILEGIEVGNEVAFEVSVADGRPRVTALQRRPAAGAN